MDFQILQVFSPEEADLFLAKVSKAHFTDGKASAFGKSAG